MRKSALSLLIAASFALGQNYYEPMLSIRNTFYGGIAFAVGEGASVWHPGVSGGIEPIKKINTYFGVGGHIDYSWLSRAELPPLKRAGLHYFDISFVPKAYLPVSANMTFSFEVDPGLYGTYAYYSYGEYRTSNFKVFFGLTAGTAFTIEAFSLIFKFKNIFGEDIPVPQVTIVNYLSLCVGIAL
jgi:hypothetical protein